MHEITKRGLVEHVRHTFGEKLATELAVELKVPFPDPRQKAAQLGRWEPPSAGVKEVRPKRRRPKSENTASGT